MSVERGREGEALAERFLARKGWTILERNWRAMGAEIDLIGRDGETLVFVEVKRRASKAFGGGAAAVGKIKQAKIVRASIGYLRRSAHAGPVRFDVVAIDGESVRHIPGAFRTQGYTR